MLLLHLNLLSFLFERLQFLNEVVTAKEEERMH